MIERDRRAPHSSRPYQTRGDDRTSPLYLSPSNCALPASEFGAGFQHKEIAQSRSFNFQNRADHHRLLQASPIISLMGKQFL